MHRWQPATAHPPLTCRPKDEFRLEHFRLAVLDNTVYITSGGLARGQVGMQPLFLHFLTQVQATADR